MPAGHEDCIPHKGMDRNYIYNCYLRSSSCIYHSVSIHLKNIFLKIFFSRFFLLYLKKQNKSTMANQMANKPEKSNSRWTENDDQRLIELTQKGSSTAKVATELGRTRSSIWARKCKLNLGDLRLQHSRGTNVPVSFSKRNPKKNFDPKETREKKNTFSEINLENAARIAKKHGLNLTVITFHP